jgi:hypothetical protein
MVVTRSKSRKTRTNPSHCQKPARYVGGESNQVVKSWRSVETRGITLPGNLRYRMSNLGLAILWS